MTTLDPAEITERLAAVERRLTDGEVDARPGADAAAVESGLGALRGLVGEVERADEAIERRADAALAGVDDLEARVAALESEAETDAVLAAEAACGPPEPSERADEGHGTDDAGDRSALARLRDAL